MQFPARQRLGNAMKQLRGLLLDVDGTLVDSNDAHAHAWLDALTEAGIHVPFEQVRRRIGMGGDKLLPEVCGLSEDSSKGQQISRRRAEIFQKHYLPSLRPTRGAHALLQHLREQHFRLVVASSAKEDELNGLLRVCGADNLVTGRISADAVDQSKPAPDIVQAALERIGLLAEEVALLGDTPYDIASARGAGVATIALRCGGWSDAELVGAVAIYDDPQDLLEHENTSPLVRGLN